jgi:peptidoglycan/LPS O-acetylase OafA/YrhL
MTSKQKIPSLDGLRAVSIALVVASHIVCARGFPHADRFAASSVPYFVGNLGVRIFFIISGFLITTLLLQEESLTGAVSIRGFLRRRVFRIAPVFFTYIGVVAALCAARILVVPWQSFFAAGTFTADFIRPHWYFGHFWSLSVEEQFYLVWPFVVGKLPRIWRWRVASVVFAAGAVAGSLLFSFGLEQPAEALSSFTTIAAGCLLALARRNPAYQRWQSSTLMPLALLACALLTTGAFFCPRPIRFGVLAISVSALITLSVDYVTRQRTWAGFLNWGPIAYVGTLSYSLYIWQELFMRVRDLEHGPPFPINLALACATAVFSYYAIEQPLIRLGRSGAGRAHKSETSVPIDAEPSMVQGHLSPAIVSNFNGSTITRSSILSGRFDESGRP